ncbi:hypothetical protein FE557_19260, partial [Clostridioides difficile]|nr:hypothetical protein [Clostridioides difficile]
HIPMKVNQSGVMPIIFASSLSLVYENFVLHTFFFQQLF